MELKMRRENDGKLFGVVTHSDLRHTMSSTVVAISASSNAAPANHGRRWTPEQEKNLLFQIESGKSRAEVASSLGRTEVSVLCRIIQALRRSFPEIEPESLATYGLTEQEVETYLRMEQEQKTRAERYDFARKLARKVKFGAMTEEDAIGQGISAEYLHKHMEKIHQRKTVVYKYQSDKMTTVATKLADRTAENVENIKVLKEWTEPHLSEAFDRILAVTPVPKTKEIKPKKSADGKKTASKKRKNPDFHYRDDGEHRETSEDKLKARLFGQIEDDTAILIEHIQDYQDAGFQTPEVQKLYQTLIGTTIKH